MFTGDRFCVARVVSGQSFAEEKSRFIFQNDGVPAFETAFDGFNSELALGFEHFKQYVTQLESGVNTAEAKSAVNEYLIQYREYYVSRPNIVGASGSVFGLLLAFGMMFPNSLIYVYFLIPVKAKWFVIVYGLIELIYGISGTADGVAHFAHLGGMLFGLLLILYWKKKAKQHCEY